MSLIINITSIVVILVSMFYYYRKVIAAKTSVLAQKVLANASQLTMSAYMLGLAVILIELNAFGLSRTKFVNHLLIYGGFVSLVNSFSLWYFSRTLKED
ncbi:hypothetical protein [Vagococcus carniphilus]|uniref:Uncharacterized protein n=1 Tax=Vagococcus carniphilus TaxID=218144 RepID=A0A430B6F1_9ENTE|nr:hypothetical protein [Vagococcus carniphilus]QNN72790.1 hypothetical protein H9L18_13170 [Vagococcus carniphilus]RSU15895.1 hypothetical protein CBF28_05530 [Vagococcus carniphilus]